MLEFAIGENSAKETLERMREKQVVGAGTPLAHIRHQYDSDGSFKCPITFARSDRNTVHISLQLDDYIGPSEARLGNRVLPFAEAGLGAMQHDEGVNCTAQHCAEGSIVVHRPGVTQGSDLQTVSSLDFVPSLLKYFNLARPAHLLGQASIQF
jgi:hypothetical protein